MFIETTQSLSVYTGNTESHQINLVKKIRFAPVFSLQTESMFLPRKSLNEISKCPTAIVLLLETI